MFFILFSFVVSKVHVPNQKLDTPFVNLVTIRKLGSYLNESSLSVVYFSSQGIDSLQMKTFRKAAITFGHRVNFSVVDDSNAYKFLRVYNASTNSLFFFKGTGLWIATKFPGSEIALENLINCFIKSSIHSVQSKEGVLSLIDSTSFSLLTNKENMEKAYHVYLNLSRDFSYIPLIIVTDELYKEFEIPSDKIGFFRKEDRMLLSVEIDYDYIMNQTKPVYRELLKTDLTQNTIPIAALICEQLTPDMDKFLFHIATKYPDFIVGFITPRFCKMVEDATLMNLSGKTTFIAFHYYDRSYYSNEKLNLPNTFQKDIYFEQCSSYLDSIKNNETKRLYHSQTDIKPINEYVEAINGEKYIDFLNDTDNNLLLFYCDENDNTTNISLNILTETSKELRKRNVTNVRIAMIDAKQNSSPKRFPYLYTLPQLRIYPINRTNEVQFIHHFTKIDILRFINRTTDIHFDDIPQKNKEEFQTEVSQFLGILMNLPKDEQTKTKGYLKQMWLDLGIKFGISTETETIGDDNDDDIEFIDDDEFSDENETDTNEVKKPQEVDKKQDTFNGSNEL